MKFNDNSTVNIQIYNDKIVLIKDILYSRKNVIDRKAVMLLNRKTEYNGYMSDSTSRKVRRIILAWSEAIKRENCERNLSIMKIDRKLVFMTLTLSDEQKHDDNWIKRKLLNSFLIKMKTDYKVNYYLWRAEKQQNGRIHFHVILDHFIDKKDIQLEWNKIQRKHGYTENYENRFGKTEPPSTHIREVTTEEQMIEYAIKYTSKKKKKENETDLKVIGRIWGCSDELRRLKVFSKPQDDKVIEHVLNDMKLNRFKHYETDFFGVIIVDTKKYLNDIAPWILREINDYYIWIYDSLYNKQDMCQVLQEIENKEIKEIKKESKLWVQLELFEFDNSDKHWDY